ncbi:hypothetical protein Tco_0561171 [Tanacetum coccineum]
MIVTREKNSGVIVEEILMDDCNDVGYSGLEEEQCQVQSDTQMAPIYVNSKKMEGNVWNKSFTIAVTKNINEYDRNLEYIPIELNENGFKMTVNELRYNLRRMWVMRFLALGWFLEEIHVTWAHLEKKRTRLRTYTKSFEDLCIQCAGAVPGKKN